MAAYLDLLLHPAASEVAGTVLGLVREVAHDLIAGTGDWFTGSSTGDAGLGSSTPDGGVGSSTGDWFTGSSYP
ncbi:hypothetical protein IU443_07920 [Nocardia farcinica]|uniref:Uncharacterized protein n=2 Tax=Nocardia farcinica TaxID=37329 RepID=Q5Z271_NOCFA|nr:MULTISPECIES: hypothetical protein [Nocardia]SLJ82896.1 Uncharacterised protein [Mycobacteroides abscessus subsp. abscessus]AXK86627.1 hypothetical protein DXT66_14225 [Nocardia farcinica]MBA4859012.1 hypothetical protein [Nocardia farcinica]MBC9819334.1 hypothetical protein [Nocardia farcinica]MBF6070579.1 hypothetical protein [Nocardia farcinica]